MGRTRASYDVIARDYKDRFEHELDEKPFDREFLGRFAENLPAGSVVVDLGCGPGQIGRHLSGLGLGVIGVDLSLEMLRQNPAGAATAGLAQADMRTLPFRNASVAGVVAFYSLIHIKPEELAGTVAETGRVVAPGGWAGFAAHATPPPERVATAESLPGGGIRITEMLSQPVDLDFYFYDLGRLGDVLHAGSFKIVWEHERDAYRDGMEAQTRRAYILARRTA
ncbi:MAG TPA: class I SAM-dependent methyltransferase [Acidimicrobiales bacterium]|nr:class I SAM-dependent methyltransferase [Acidimicrobiales bacterium]